MQKQGMFFGKPNEEYHKADGYHSSSALKLLLENPVKYYKKYKEKSLKEEKKDHFDVGNAIHTKILEPHKFDEEVTFFEGTKRGEKWNKFKAANEKKIILGDKSKFELETLVEGIKGNPNCMPLVSGKAEVSIYVKINGFPVKVRFDILNMDKGYGMDLKSTTGQLIGDDGIYQCRKKIRDMKYDLSAALYLDALNTLLEILAKKQGKKAVPINTWYWIFASKEYEVSRIIKASPQMLENGRLKYQEAIRLFNKYEADNWKNMDIADYEIVTVDSLDNYKDLIGSSSIVEVATW